LSKLGEQFTAKLTGKDGKKIELHKKEEVQEILKVIEKAKYIVTDVKKGTRKRTPAPPFTTSTMQQEASRKIGFSIKKTMSVAQGLYEGVKVPEKGVVGLITYMRTDSTRISDVARAAAKKHIESTYGTAYYENRYYKTKEGAQDAHEAIRPTYIDLTPDKLKDSLTNDQYKLYNLIYNRFIASQMSAAVFDTIAVGINANDYNFKANGQNIKFHGFMKLYVEDKDEKNADDDILLLPSLEVGQKLKNEKIDAKQSFTEPPARYTEASIVKTLDMKVSTGMGPTELIMMILIMIFGIVQEFLIALFTPKSTIDRKMLSRFDAYFGADFNIDLFLLVTYKDYLKKGIINQKTFEAKSKKCVELMEDTIEDVIVRYSKKKKPVSQIIKGSMYKFNLQDTENINDPEIVESTITANDSEKYTVKPAKVKPVEAPKTEPVAEVKEEPSEPVVEATKEEVKSEPEVMPIRETKPSKILRETNSPRLQRMYGDTVESQAIPATIETPVVEMKPVEAEQPAENKDEANINMEKLQKLNEALNSFESALEDK
jgi:hypothetical protein